jgi:hypothetical protein
MSSNNEGYNSETLKELFPDVKNASTLAMLKHALANPGSNSNKPSGAAPASTAKSGTARAARKATTEKQKLVARQKAAAQRKKAAAAAENSSSNTNSNTEFKKAIQESLKTAAAAPPSSSSNRFLFNFGSSPASTAKPAAALTPSEYFSGPYTDYDTIEKLNTYIGTVMKDHLGKEEIQIVGRLSKNLPSKCREKDPFKQKVCNWDVIFSSGDKFDCLIHTFLTMVSVNFRRLSQEFKNDIASAFRRRLFLKFPEVKSHSSRVRIEERVPMVEEFLTDDEITVLAKTYHINILVFEKVYEAASMFGYFPDVPTAYVMTNNGGHYESVYVGNSFTISRDTVDQIQESFAQTFTGEQRPICNYPGTERPIEEGDLIEYEGDIYQVIEKQYGEAKKGKRIECNQLKVKSLSTEEESEIPIGGVSPFNNSSGGKRHQTRRKRRSSRRSSRR